MRGTRGEIPAGYLALDFPRAEIAPSRLIVDDAARTRHFDWRTPGFDNGHHAADDDCRLVYHFPPIADGVGVRRARSLQRQAFDTGQC